MKSTAGLLPQIICRYKIHFLNAILQRGRPWPSLKKNQNCKEDSFIVLFSLYTFSLPCLWNHFTEFHGNCSQTHQFCPSPHKTKQTSSNFWRLRTTENLDDSGHEMSLFTIRILSSQILWISVYVHMVFIGRLLEVIGDKLSG